MMLFSIRSSIDDGFSVFFAWLPRAVGFVAVLIIGYFIARIVAKLVQKATHRGGLDRAMHGGPGGNIIQRAVPVPSRLLGTITFWALFLGAVSIAASVLGIAALTTFIGAVWAYIPNVAAALLIFLVAGAVAGAAVALAHRVMGDTALGNIVAAAVPILVMTIATFMILEQLRIAPAIVEITYTALIGAIALASALAFGLGGRDVAARMLEGAYQAGQEHKDQFRRELDVGATRAKAEVREKKDDLQAQNARPPAPGATSRA